MHQFVARASTRFLLGLAAACLFWPASPARATEVGYNEDPARLEAVPLAVEYSNTDIARISYLWPAIEPVDDEFHWSKIDGVVELLRQAGIRPMITIFGSPTWAAHENSGIACACDRDSDPDWQQMWQQVAQRYPDAVLGIWNEPNHPAYGPVGDERMAELVNEGASAIWDVAPDAEVVGPPMAPVGDWLADARALYPKLDPRVQMAANVYPSGALMRNLRADLREVRTIADGRPIWITETNVSRLSVTTRRQQRYVRRAYALADRWNLRSLIFHRLWSPASPLFDPWDAGQSALESDGTPLPLFGQIGRLNPGFRPLVVPPPEEGGSGIVTGPPPDPYVPVWGPPVSQCSLGGAQRGVVDRGRAVSDRANDPGSLPHLGLDRSDQPLGVTLGAGGRGRHGAGVAIGPAVR